MIRFLYTSIFLLCISSGLMANSEIDTLLVKLEQVMSKRDSFDIIRQNRLLNLKELLTKNDIGDDQKFYLQNQLIEEYRTYNFDSTLNYINKNLSLAKKINKPTLINESNLEMARLLASSGRYLEALDVLKLIDKSLLDKNLLIDYYNDLLKLYSDLSIYSPSTDNANSYSLKSAAYTDSLLRILDEKSEPYLSLMEKRYRDSRDLDKCEQINSQRLSGAKIGTPLYSMITFERSLLFGLKKEPEKEKKYLILSAISDIMASVKDNASLTILALILHGEKDIDRAHKYIKFSFEDASFYNSKLRFIELSNIMPLITEAYQLKSEQQSMKLKRYLIIISLLSLVLTLAFLYIVNQMKKLAKTRNDLQTVNSRLNQLNTNLSEANTNLHNLNVELSETNHVKEHYIGNFLTICSDYIDKIDDIRRNVNKQILAGKVEELLKTTKSRKLIDDEVKAFYENFDSVFLHIYPNFVEKLNSLLEEGEQIELKKDEMLNTELRIFALIRLGISDSSRIAKLLRYSVNTIYNYRVKVKNKALSRDDFEDQVMKIGAILR
ncbi:DUF6377 domain-containing protein [Plebeiibacterium sediminum]|uniref:DUF6377 domain-containing protein n=1 Tax=Plebeiibacterium sediminum TaxID=2992112 RepID=A0AAE3M4G6_9BACT|nr:DUF6377 domain-containing protein [Plebeiobacterium sediminum]MCW3786672.1 DUF6377 domain-containing protein [Plebeiobacterium sediminum]